MKSIANAEKCYECSKTKKNIATLWLKILKRSRSKCDQFHKL